MMRWFFLALLLVMTGCQLKVSSPTAIVSATLPAQIPNTLRFVSIDFLPPELSKLEPHVRLSASMRVSVTQPQAIKYVLGIKTERWANGKLIPSHGSGWQTEVADGSGDISCSFQQSEKKQGLLHFNQVIATRLDRSSSTLTGDFELPYQQTATSLTGSRKL